MQLSQIKALIPRLIANTQSPEELQAFEEWLQRAPEAELEEVMGLYYDQLPGAAFHDAMDPALPLKLKARLEQADTGNIRPLRRRRLYYAAAAAVLLMCMAGAYLFLQRHHHSDTDLVASKTGGPIVPGGSKAVLTLANGAAVVLDGAQNGPLPAQGSSRLLKQDSGHLVYHATAGDASPAYNTITTPCGGQFHVTLSDGTQVWLNAGSSLRFPAAFTGHERLVSLTGQAYFEVAGDAARPFRVAVGKMTIDVLGTDFDVMAYEEEDAINTTLLNGSVRVNSEGRSIVLQRGLQCRLDKKRLQLETGRVNAAAAIAWKNGYFRFDKVDIKTIMRQIARWYDVEVAYEGPVPGDKFIGSIRRTAGVEEVLQVIAASDVHFRIEGRKITVVNKTGQ